MDKQARVAALLDKHKIEPASGVDFLVADSTLKEIEENIFYYTENFTAEEIATHLFLTRASKNPDIEPCQASAIVYPISLATLATNILPKEGALIAEAEIRRLQESGRPIIFLSMFDFSLGQQKRTTIMEQKVMRLVQRDMKLYRLSWIRACDRVVQFEQTTDLLSNCTVFPLTLTPLQVPTKNRPWLFNFVGNTTKDHWPAGMVRSPEQQPIWDQLAAENSDHWFIGDAPKTQTLTNSNAYFDIPANSTFTLCPRGIANWTFRLYESILSGSIPVILSDTFIPPMGELQWNSFSLRYPESKLHEIGKILTNIDKSEIALKQQRLAEIQNRFTASGLQELWLDWVAGNFRKPESSKNLKS